MIKFTTTLAENAETFCEGLCGQLESSLSAPVSFKRDATFTERIGSLKTGTLQLGWLCGLLYTNLRDQGATLEPLLAPVDTAYARPLYTSYLVVHRDNPAQAFAELAGSHLVVNERGSFSGYEILRYTLAKRNLHGTFFAEVTLSGSHTNSLAALLTGRADVATIDHTVFRFWQQQQPERAAALKVLEELEPFPAPPWVVHASVSEPAKQKLRAAFAELPKGMLEPFGFSGFKTVNDTNYDPIRRAVETGATVQL